ncbi:unnamed protein product, partial [Ascophyllum nodosum]
MGVVREQGWSGSIDNSAHLNASGQVVDTGIGAMVALDVAREQQLQHHKQAESVTQGTMAIGGVREGYMGTKEEKQQQQDEQVPAPRAITARGGDQRADDWTAMGTPA